LGGFSVFVYTNYENVTENIPSPIIFFGKLHL